MADLNRQRFRTAGGTRMRGFALREGEIAVGLDGKPTTERKSDPALEAAMRPFYSTLTVKEREAVAAYFDDVQPDERTAAAALRIHQRTLQERLFGREERRSSGAIAKVREALMEALPDEIRRALEDDEPGAYVALRRWLTPAENIREDGTEDPWIEAPCIVCGARALAFWRPNTIQSGDDRFEEPRIYCAVHEN
jgi:hypothetical protein